MNKLHLNRVEFYKRGGGMINAVRSATVPRAGEYINISREQWRVSYVSWSIDSDGFGGDELRANVELEKVPNDEVGPITLPTKKGE